MKINTFLFISFLVGCVADIILHDLSNWTNISNGIIALKPYFKQRPILISAFYAGLTILIATILLYLIIKYFYKDVDLTFNNYSWKEIIGILIIAYILGYILDILIDKFNLFGNSLRPFYNVAGSGHWGAISFILALIVSYNLHKFILPFL